MIAGFRRTFLAAALAALASCSAAPLAGTDCIAVAPPVFRSADRTAARAGSLVARHVASSADASTRLAVVTDTSACDGRTAVLHCEVDSFEPASEGRTGSARSRFLVCDLAGRPIACGSALSLSRFAEGPDPADALARGIGVDSARFLRSVAGQGPKAVASPAAPADQPFQHAYPAPRDWPSQGCPGRAGARARLFMLSPGGAAAGIGAGSPRLDDAFSPAPGAGVSAWWAPMPGLSVEAAFGKAMFAGREFSSGGLSVGFDDLEVLCFTAGARLLLPLRYAPGRWWSSWDPFADTRGLNAVLFASAGLAGTSPVAATIRSDLSGEVPTLAAGTRIPYYRRSVTGVCEAFAGLEARFGPDGGPLFSATLSAGFFASAPPKAEGAGSGSGMVAGPGFMMEIGAGF